MSWGEEPLRQTGHPTRRARQRPGGIAGRPNPPPAVACLFVLCLLSQAATTATARNTSAESEVPIFAIQGAGHHSPFVGETVTTSGIVTAVENDGFFLQDPHGDGDDDTSDAIYVYTKNFAPVTVSDHAEVTGEVIEFTSGGERSGNLSMTEISLPERIQVGSSGNPLPHPVIIGRRGRLPPTEVIDDDELCVYEPHQDGIDFYESLEAMRVTVEDAAPVSATNRFGEIFVVSNQGRMATGMNSRGGITATEGDANPERIQVDGRLLQAPMPVVNPGDLLGDVTGVMGYSYGNFEVLAEAAPQAIPSGLAPEVTFLTGDEAHVTIASYNVQNLDPGDPPERFRRLGEHIAWNLHSPDIVALQEVQDNSGPSKDGVTSADLTGEMLTSAILEAGGPVYEYHDVAPEDDSSGGEPGGNIRVGFLVNPHRVGLLAGSLQSLDDPGGAFRNARRPLQAVLRFGRHHLTLINCHFSSRSGSTPLFGAVQPPVEHATTKRTTQAAFLRNHVRSLLDRDPTACVVALGDFNDTGFAEPLLILAGGGSPLVDLSSSLPKEERYSHNYQGNSQSLDHILVNAERLEAGAALDIVHVNADFADPVSDHDPVIARVAVPRATAGTSMDDAETVDPAAVQLSQNVPNPFNSSTSIAYALRRPGLVQLRIFNTAGQLVRTLVNSHRANGRYQLAWEADDQDGRRLSNGIYSCQLEMDQTTLTRRMALIR